MPANPHGYAGWYIMFWKNQGVGGDSNTPQTTPSNTRFRETSRGPDYAWAMPGGIHAARTRGGTVSRLTVAQARNLRELADIAERGHGEAYWHPETPGEWACARALARKGLVTHNPSRGVQPYTLKLTDKVREALKEARS